MNNINPNLILYMLTAGCAGFLYSGTNGVVTGVLCVLVFSIVITKVAIPILKWNDERKRRFR